MDWYLIGNIVANVALTVAIILALFFGFWPLINVLNRLTSKAVKLLLIIHIKLCRLSLTVWDWIQIKNQIIAPAANNNRFTLDNLTLGFFFLLAGVIMCCVDFTLLRTAYEVLFYGISGKFDFIGAFAVVTVIALTVTGIMWREAIILFTKKPTPAQLATVEKTGLIATFIIALLISFLSANRTKALNGGEIVAATFTGLLTFAISFAIAYALSYGFRYFLLPIADEISRWLVRTMPQSRIVAKFILAIPVWIIIGMFWLLVLLALLIVMTPQFLLDLRKEINEWLSTKLANWKERRAKAREDKVAATAAKKSAKHQAMLDRIAQNAAIKQAKLNARNATKPNTPQGRKRWQWWKK